MTQTMGNKLPILLFYFLGVLNGWHSFTNDVREAVSSLFRTASHDPSDRVKLWHPLDSLTFSLIKQDCIRLDLDHPVFASRVQAVHRLHFRPGTWVTPCPSTFFGQALSRPAAATPRHRSVRPGSERPACRRPWQWSLDDSVPGIGRRPRRGWDRRFPRRNRHAQVARGRYRLRQPAAGARARYGVR